MSTQTWQILAQIDRLHELQRQLTSFGERPQIPTATDIDAINDERVAGAEPRVP
jgi:hypothetical protein